jgi:hypothetical protein
VATEAASKSSRQTSWAAILGAPAIAAVLVIAWLLPFVSWAIVTVGVVSTMLFLLVLVAHRDLSLRALTRPGVLAALVMYAIALFTVAYAALELRQPDSIQTDGSGHPGSLGVAALVATSMGIAGGEVGAQVRQGARVVAHIQLLLVIGALAGAGGQVLQRLARQASDEVPPSPPVPPDPLVDLYRRVHDRLTDRGGDAVLQELELSDHENAPMWRERISSLPEPDVASTSDAVAVSSASSLATSSFPMARRSKDKHSAKRFVLTHRLPEGDVGTALVGQRSNTGCDWWDLASLLESAV